MKKYLCSVVLSLSLFFVVAPCFASGVGPSDWAGEADLVVLGSITGISGDGPIQNYFFQPEEVFHAIEPQYQGANFVDGTHFIEVLTSKLPDEAAVAHVLFLKVIEGQDNKFQQIASISLDAAGLQPAVDALKEWVAFGLTSNHKINPKYKELIFKNLQSGHPELVRLAIEESVYIQRKLSVDDGKILEKLLYESTDSRSRKKLCLRLISIKDPVFLGTWVRVLGESEHPKSIIGPLRRFKKEKDNPNSMHAKLDNAIKQMLHYFEQVQSGASPEELKKAEAVTAGLKHENYLQAVGHLKLLGCLPALQRVFDYEHPTDRSVQFALLSLGRLQVDDIQKDSENKEVNRTLERFEQYVQSGSIELAGAAYLGLAYWGARDDETIRQTTCKRLAGVLLDEKTPVVIKQVVLHGFSSYGENEIAAYLVQCFEHETNPDVFKEAFAQLKKGKRTNRTITAAIVAILERLPENEKVMTEVIPFLTKQGHRSAVPGLWEILENNAIPKNVRKLAFQGIRRLGKKKDIRALSKFVKTFKTKKKGK